MKKIKVIDLLNKIANGEEVPKKVKYRGEVYDYIKIYKEAIRYTNLEREQNDEYRMLIFSANALNDEVEIIEDTPKEDKKIEKLDRYEYIINCVTDISKTLDAYQDKINEIIDKVNGE